MSGFTTALAALLLSQGAAPAPLPDAPAPAPAAEKAPAPVAPSPRPEPAPPAAAPAPPARAAAPAVLPARPAPSPAPAAPRSASAAPAPPAAGAPAGSAAAAPPASEREQVARTALAFLDALLAGDVPALAGLSGDRFSFDGDVQSGRDAVRRAFRTGLSPRTPGRDVLLDLEILPGPDAVSRLGPPPARLAPLAARGSWVAIANVSGRPVVLFLSRAEGRWVVVGLHG
ncbi:MAG TPA: hypothetical protein VML50_17245 [Anaeromyxobacter sp.]|nr:hypothetical protein [Anaeromyxobacter sp.]